MITPSTQRPRRSAGRWLTGPELPWLILILLFVYFVVFPMTDSYRTVMSIHNTTQESVFVTAVSPPTRQAHSSSLRAGARDRLLVWSAADTIEGIESHLVHVFAFSQEGRLLQHTTMTIEDSRRRSVDLPIEILRPVPLSEGRDEVAP